MATQQYIHQLKQLILRHHNVSAKWVESVAVEEIYNSQTLWRGTVEIFDLTDHPKAKRAYAWSHVDEASKTRTRFVAVLELPPVVSPQTAVRISLAADAKAKLRKQIEKAEAEIVRRNQRN